MSLSTAVSSIISENGSFVGEQFNNVLSNLLSECCLIGYHGSSLQLNANGAVETSGVVVARYEKETVIEEGEGIKPIRTFYRVGTTHVS